MPQRHGIHGPDRPDVMVLGFQEIVPLTAQQIVQTDPEKKPVVHYPVSSYPLIRCRQTHMGEQNPRDPRTTA